MIPAWASDYVGIPFADKGRSREGVDCYGLLALVLRERFNVVLPSYVEEYATSHDSREVAALIERECGPWRPVKLGEARAGDGILLRVMGQPWHVGIVLEAPAFLHVMRGIESAIERWDRPAWTHRVLGIFRHEALA